MVMSKIIKKIVIVEGKNDYTRIKHIYPNLPILTTNGSEVSDEFLDLVKKLSLENEIVLLLDPDYSGEYIRKKIQQVCPNASHAFVQKKDAISKNKKKVGIEHVELDILAEVLANVVSSNYHLNVTIEDLFELGLVGKKDSKIKREKLCSKLKIGYVNGKQLVNRLNLFNITLEEVKDKL